MEYAYLDENKKICELPFEEWLEKRAMEYENFDNRRVAQDFVGNINISTVFLTMNHSWNPGKKLWFETMIFGGKHDDYQERYETWDEAVAGHKKALEMVKNEQNE